MAGYAYQKYDEAHMARGSLRDANLSFKHAIEICNFIRKKPVKEAIKTLELVIKHKVAVPMKRFTNGAGHKPGKIAAGKYPEKASEAFIMLLNSVTKNAEQKNLDADTLVIEHIAAQKANEAYRAGRHRGRTTKRSHVEIVVKEGEIKIKKDKKSVKKDAKIETVKTETPKSESTIKTTKEPKVVETKETEIKEQKVAKVEGTPVEESKETETKKELNEATKEEPMKESIKEPKVEEKIQSPEEKQ